MIEISGDTLRVQSQTTTVEFTGILLTSVRDSITGEEFLDRDAQEGVPGFELLHQNGKFSPQGVHPLASQVFLKKLSDNIAEILLNDWECDLSIRVSIDPSNGDILVEPSAWTMQGGVAGIGWNIAGVRRGLDVLGPFQQGAKLPFEHPQMAGKNVGWPDNWEAGFLVFEGEGTGFTIQTWDEHFLFKGIHIGHEKNPRTVAFLTLAYGPLEGNRCVGNLAWRIRAFRGDWKIPVGRYREWYWKAYRLEEAARLRPEWLEGITLAVSWCPSQIDLLESLAKLADPRKVFLHLPNWRIHQYDQDYPTYIPD